MAFALRADGLVDVDTPMGPLPMAPDIAKQLGWVPGDTAPGMPPVAPPTLGQAGATAELSQGDRDVLGIPGAPRAFSDPALSKAMGTEDTSTLIRPNIPTQATPSAMASSAAPTGPSALQELLANPPSTMASSTTRRTGIPVTGPNRQAIDTANQDLIGAEQKAARAMGAQADAQTAQAELEAQQAQAMVKSERDRLARERALVDGARQKRDAIWAKIPDKLDETRWDKTGGVGQVLAAVSLMLGGISQGITGRENPAKGIVDGIVQNDLDLQRAEIQLAEQEGQRADNELQDYLDTYGDPILAEKQLEITANAAFIKELQARAQAATGEQVKAAAAAGIAERQAEIARLNNEMDGRVGEMVTQSQTNPELNQGIWKTQVGVLADQQSAQNDPFHGMDDRSKRDAVARLVILPSGQKGFAPTEKEGLAMRQAKAAYDQYSKNVDQLLELAAQGENLSLDGRGKMEAIIQSNALAIKTIYDLGALVGADWGIVDPLSGKGVKDLIAPGAKEMLRTSRKIMADDLSNKWQTNLLAAPFSMDLLNPGGGVQELPGPGD